MKTANSSRGFTLIEVLIAILVLAIGLLGMASLTMTSLQSNQGAYLRSQASLLSFDIVERMRANWTEATTTNSYVLTASAAATSDPGCAASGCIASQQAQLDLSQWRADLANSIPGATAVISRTNNQYTITISWQESSALNRGTTQQNSAESLSYTMRVDL